MPFKSEAQRRWMYATHPKMAKKWEKHTPKGKKLPERVEESFERRIDNILNNRIDISISNNGIKEATRIMKRVVKSILNSESKVEMFGDAVRLGSVLKLKGGSNIELENTKSEYNGLVEDPGYSIGWSFGDRSGNLREHLKRKLKGLSQKRPYNISNESYEKYFVNQLVTELTTMADNGTITGLSEWSIGPSLLSKNIVIKPR
jgi:hypothetical protein